MVLNITNKITILSSTHHARHIIDNYYHPTISQEQAEREWRRKEGDEALKKAQAEEVMRKARTEQIQGKEHFMAVQAQRERVEFERVLR